jgi:hypothetical protein
VQTEITEPSLSRNTWGGLSRAPEVVSIHPCVNSDVEPAGAPVSTSLVFGLPNGGGLTTSPSLRPSPAESLSGARLSFRRLFPPIFRDCARFERAEKPARDPGDVVDCRIESGFVRLGWCIEAADLPDELQRRSANLFLRDRRFKVEERPNVSTHDDFPFPRTLLLRQGTAGVPSSKK